jgi:hypothetical protein
VALLKQSHYCPTAGLRQLFHDPVHQQQARLSSDGAHDADHETLLMCEVRHDHVAQVLEFHLFEQPLASFDGAALLISHHEWKNQILEHCSVLEKDGSLPAARDSAAKVSHTALGEPVEVPAIDDQFALRRTESKAQDAEQQRLAAAGRTDELIPSARSDLESGVVD